MRLINRHPGIVLRAALIALPFILLFIAYAMGSQARLADNPLSLIHLSEPTRPY